MTRRVAFRRPVLFAAALVIASLAAAAADTTSRGGIVTGVTANGNAGFLSARITNPFNLPVSGFVNFTTSNVNGSTTTVSIQYNLGPGGTENFNGSPGQAFGTSTIGAQLSDASGTNSATGYATSTVATQCNGCPNDS